MSEYLSPGQKKPRYPRSTYQPDTSPRLPIAGRTAVEASRGRNLAGKLPREVPVALDAEADERSHGNAPMLDLGVAQEADRRLIACSARYSFFV